MSTYTIWCVLHEAGFRWGKDRSWCATGTALRQRKHGTVTVTDPEAAYRQDVLPVWTEDEAGPYQTVPSPGSHWHPTDQPVRYPHE